MRKSATVLDVFSGAGGMAHGAKLAGLEIATAVENDPNAAATYHLNHKSTVLLDRDIRSIISKDLPSRKNDRLLIGGPPCQGFSSSNQRTRSHENPDIQLVKEFIRIAKIWQPEWIVFENVRGFYESFEGEYFDYLCEELNTLKYSISWDILNSANFGVPQIRNRLFLIAVKGNTPPPRLPKGTAKFVTVSQAFSGLPNLQNGATSSFMPYSSGGRSHYSKSLSLSQSGCWNNLVTRNSPLVVERYSYIPEGGNWQNIPEHLMSNYKDKERCHTGIYRRLQANQPSIVIGNFRKNMLIHPTQDRGLSVREAARLQSFRDDYLFEGSIGFQQQQVGNAVPPLLAKAVFETIINNL